MKEGMSPKIATELVGDMPSFMPPGKIPFITHICKQAQKVPRIPAHPLATAFPINGLTVKTNRQITNGMRAWIWLGKGLRNAGTQMMLAMRAIIIAVRTESSIETLNLEV